MPEANFNTYFRTNGQGEPVSGFHGSKKDIDPPAAIAALIPRGEVIRNFVYTGAFDLLQEKASLSLISVNPNSAITEMLAGKYGEIHPLEEIREHRLVAFQRELIDLAHGRWLWSKAAQARWQWHDADANTLRLKAVRTAKKIISRPFSNRTGLRALSKIERASSYRLRTTDRYLKLFEKLAPSLVFNGSHIHCRNAVQAVQAAQWLGIPTATFIFSWDNLTSQGRIILPYDYFLVWSEALKKQLLEMYEQIRPEQVFVTGTPQFDFHFQERFYEPRENFCRSIGADPCGRSFSIRPGWPIICRASRNLSKRSPTCSKRSAAKAGGRRSSSSGFIRKI